MNFLVELREGLLISWASIRANKLRSVLTTLGIIIGIVTVTLMGTALEGLNRSFMQSISVIGADVLYVDRMNWFAHSHEEWQKMQKRREITLAQVRLLGKQLTLASVVAPMVGSNETIRSGKKHSDNVRILGTTDEFLNVTGMTLAQGRFLTATESEGGRPVCVIGYAVATNLFQKESALGKSINIGEQRFEVVGTLGKQGSFLDGESLDNQAVIPLQTYLNAINPHPDFQAQVKVRDLKRIEDARDEVRGTLRKIRRVRPGDPDDFAINQQEQFVDLFHQVTRTIASIGFFITSLSLFVGGIGIMNIMFVSVAERTKEIGIRKAIGAKRRTILVQFLSEAASICLLGGAIALAIAWPLTLVMHRFFPATLSLRIVGIAMAVSLITGLLSGFFPAYRAARMDPVEALRNE
jgi:putative ABC transport system permease protein